MKSTDLEPLLIVAGPTAVGKSAVVMELAKGLGREVVSLDSVQVYRGLDIGSAKPTAEERHLVRHHLVDVLSPDVQGNVAEFLKLADGSLEEIRERGKRAICAGGTGLYTTALLRGLADFPPSNPIWRQELEGLAGDVLASELRKLDPGRADELHPNDRVRIIRAIESARARGRGAAELRAEHAACPDRHKALILVLCRERVDLYARVNDRAKAMVQAGLLKETERIVSQYGLHAPALKSLGYAQCVRALEGQLSEDQLADEIALQTRRFAKRQMTFWRNEPRKRGWAIVSGSVDDVRTGSVSRSDGGGLEVSFSELESRVGERLRLPFVSSEVWLLNADRLLA